MKEEVKEESASPKKAKTIYFIDAEKFETEEETLSVGFLLAQAQQDPANTTLATRHGNQIHKFNDVNETVEIKNGMKFIVLHNTPTTVSHEA